MKSVLFHSHMLLLRVTENSTPLTVQYVALTGGTSTWQVQYSAKPAAKVVQLSSPRMLGRLMQCVVVVVVAVLYLLYVVFVTRPRVCLLSEGNKVF